MVSIIINEIPNHRTPNIEQVHATTAHSQGNYGQGVKVAIFDTGITEHSDLLIAGGTSFIEGAGLQSEKFLGWVK